jgi:pilus assembly protein CpaE
VAREESQRRRAKGLLIAVFGPRPGVGVTTVSASLARSFRALGAERVAFAELDARAVRARSSAIPASSVGADRLAIPGITAALVRTPDEIWALTMTRPRTPAVGDAKGVTVALDAIRERFPVAVAELEHQVNERTLAAFDAADRILLVTEGAVPSLRGIQRVLRLCQRLNYPDEKLCVILNDTGASSALPAGDVAVVLKREIYWNIPEGSRLTTDGLAEKLLSV